MPGPPLGTALVMGLALFAAGCGTPDKPVPPPAPKPLSAGGFRSGDCNLVTDDEVEKAVSSSVAFNKVIDGDAGCFWQEDSMLGSVGAGMGISTWWYRGSDMDTERLLEQQAGRTVTELELSGNKGFRAQDSNACSIYVAKDGDVIIWSMQTLNPAMLPDLCSVTEQLAQLSQDRVN
ncbi:DUF3558 domain-containing protein [soil metagenome]